MILPNAANQCTVCLAQEVDLKAILQRGPGGGEITIHQCRQCRRHQRSEKVWDLMEPESPELLALCLKSIPALAPKASPKMHLADAIWVWTEPNSMRLKIRVTVQTETQDVKIQQRVLVEFHVRFKQCNDCNREYTNRTWHAVLQLRQRRFDDAPRKGLVVLEMALARNPQVRKHVLKIDTSKHGFDFYFLNLSEANQFASYISRVAPMRIKVSKKLVSTDVKNNTANLQHTVACDMVPLCRDDLIMVSKAAKGNLSGRLCLVVKMSSVVHLVDASPKRAPTMEGSHDELAPETYYKAGGEKAYKLLMSSRRMTKFVVLDVERCGEEQYGDQSLYEGPQSGVDKFALADVEVARESDFGQNDETFRCVTHLGNLLQPGDVVLGYDLAASVISGGDDWDIEHGFNHSFVMPDILLVKKLKGVSDEDEEVNDMPDSTGTKKRGRRGKRDEKKMRELEGAASRMGFLEVSEMDEAQFEQELVNDPMLAEELRIADLEFASVKVTKEVVLEQSDNDSDTSERHADDGSE